jgi:4-amino-4-deoxy-L-arabinose transferase-like glycosyltransferase
MRNPREILRAQPWFALAIVGLGAAAWIASIPEDLRRTFLGQNQWGRFSGQDWEGGHRQPFWYYLPAFAYALAPWSALLLPATPWIWRRDDVATPKRFLIVWLLLSVVLLSVAATKREIYLLPIAPAAAILVAGWLERETERPKWATAMVGGVGGVIALGFLGVLGGAVYFKNWIGLALVAALTTTTVFAARRRWVDGLGLGAASLVACAALVFVPLLDRRKDLSTFALQLHAIGSVAAFDPDETTLAVIPFYTGLDVRPIATLDEAARAADAGPAQIVVTIKHDKDTTLEALKAKYPYVWIDEGEPGGRRMVLLSNYPK